MMKALIAAARAALEDDSALQSLAPGGIHAGRAPAQTVMPFIVMTYAGGGRADYDTAGTALAAARITFEAFAESAARAAEISQRMIRVFESAPPALDTGSCLSALMAADALRIESALGGEGQDVWRGAVEMEFLVERPAV